MLFNESGNFLVIKKLDSLNVKQSKKIDNFINTPVHHGNTLDKIFTLQNKQLSCAVLQEDEVELYRISNEINSAQEYMLEKLAGLLTPEVYTAPRPAHAVVHARPVEPDTQVLL